VSFRYTSRDKLRIELQVLGFLGILSSTESLLLLTTTRSSFARYTPTQ
jgi:hypothetical protein